MASSSASTVAFEGAIATAQRDALAGELSIAADPARADCILFDAEAAAPTPERINQIIDAGQTVILLNPKPDHLRELGKIGGISFTMPMPAVALSRSPKGNFCLTAFPESELKAPSGTAEPQPAPHEKPPQTPIGQRIAMLLRTGNVLAATDPGSPLNPPGGSYFGSPTLQVALNAQVGPIGDDCYENAGQYQSVSGLSRSKFYVYWVNGSNPYSYLVIEKKLLTGSVGQVLNMDPLSRGFVMYGAWSYTNLGNPSAGQITLIATSPNAGDTFASVQQPMQLNAFVTGSGFQNQAFTASDQSAISLPDWSLQNKSNPETPVWWFYENAPWNPATTGALPSGDDWHDILLNDGVCLPFSTISTSSLSADTYAAWTITNTDWTTPPPPAPAPQPCTLTGSLYLEQDNIIAWAWGGSKSGIPHYQLFQNCASAPYTLDLDKIAVKTPA